MTDIKKRNQKDLWHFFVIVIVVIFCHGIWLGWGDIAGGLIKWDVPPC